MKRPVLLLATCSLKLFAPAQEAFIPKDFYSEPYGHQWNYLKNAGQCYDLGGNYREDIQFQSVGTNPTISVLKEARTALCVPFFYEADHSLDHTIRFDWSFVGEGAKDPDPELFDEVGAHWNFYQEHTPDGVTDVRGGKRVVKQGIYESIDYHVLSNAYGPKFLIVVRPGGDPNEILLKFDGQDSMKVDVDGTLKLYVGEEFVKLEQALAYQQDEEEVILVPWSAEYDHSDGSVFVSLTLGEYDTELPLILMIRPWQPSAMGGGGGGGVSAPEWCTYLNGSDQDGIYDMTPGNGGYVYFAGNSRSTAGFPIEPGDYQAVNLGLSDVIYGRFNSNYELETPGTWMTYLGGTGYDYATSIAYDPGHDRIWLCGGLPSSSPANFPLISNPSCYQHTGASMGFVAFAGADDGFIDYLTHYQAVPIAEITGIDCDAFGNAYVVGWGDPDGFDPVSLSGSADYFYGGPFPYVGVNLEDGFIARFTPDADHVWETTLRGPDVEYIRGVHVDRPHGKIYVYGMTRTPNATGTVDGSTGCEQYEFPLKSGGGWYQNIKHNGTIPFWSFDALLMRFDAATLGLDWSTYMGGSGGWDNITDVISDAAGNIYATGYTDSPSYSSIPCVTSSLDMGFPSCHPGSEYFQAVYGGNTDNFMLKFDLNTAMLWATWVGGSKREKEFPTNNFFFPRLALAGHPENSVTLYASTVSGSDVLNTDPPVPMTPDADYYQQLWHADVGTGATDPADCYYGVFGTDGSPRNASYFGGVGNDWPGGVTVTGGRLYLAGGTTANVNFPLSCPPAWLGTDPYCNSTPLCGPTTADAYLAQVRSVLLNVGEGEPPSQSADGLQAYPNPTDGEIVLVDPDGLAGKQVRVLDARGRCVLQMRPQAGTKAQLDLREQADGLYLVGVIGSEVRYIRVVKE